VGYGLANSVLIEGPDSLIIIDVLESNEAAQVLKSDFSKISRKPIKALIYTHNHTDHTSGAAGMVASPLGIDVYAHASTAALMDQQVNLLREATTRRAMRMFGNYLTDRPDLHVNCGIGSRLMLDGQSTLTTYRPTITFQDRLHLRVAGIHLELIHAPGETPDQLYVWLPEKRVLVCADNLYRAFPNLYTIRGTPYRDVLEWMRSVDRIRAMAPDILVPMHSRPIKGREKILEISTAYRDAIQFVHDQTIRAINRGLSPEEAAQTIRLPEHLARHPYLQEFYGKVSWSVKNIFHGYLGFFDGNPSRLHPLPDLERARRMAELAGGADALARTCRKAVAGGDFQWALELTDQLLALEPDNPDYLAMRNTSLEALGERESNPNARHYYFTSALESQPGFLPIQAGIHQSTLRAFPLAAFFASLTCHLVPDKSMGVERSVVFTFSDTPEVFSLFVRRGVCEVQQKGHSEPNLRVRTTSETWKACLAGLQSLPAAVLSGDIRVESGGIPAFLQFMALFKD